MGVLSTIHFYLLTKQAQIFEVVAYQVAPGIVISKCKDSFQKKLHFSDSDELFYELDLNKYLYVFQYGMLSFFNLNIDEIDSVLDELRPYLTGEQEHEISEEFGVEIRQGVLKVNYNSVVLPKLNTEMIRLVMLNASQSVALNRYAKMTEELLVDTNEHTVYLENKGRLDISGVRLKQFIGKVLNLKNKISENLYIFDSPEITWDNEILNRLNLDLKSTFDLKDRYRHIHDRLGIIKENLELFKAILDHRESSRLEWIIIILILVEVVDLFIFKFLN